MTNQNKAARQLVEDHQNLLINLNSTIPKAIDRKYELWKDTNEESEISTFAKNLSSLFNLHAAIIEFKNNTKRQSMTELYRACNEETGDPEIQEMVIALREKNSRLFDAKNGKSIAAIWFNATVAEQGEEDLTLSQATEEWLNLIQQIQSEIGRTVLTTTLHASDLTHNTNLPSRTDLKIGSKRVKGWANVSYNPEAGKQAVEDEIHCIDAGRTMLRLSQ